MKRYSIDFAFDDESGTYTCFAKNLGQAIDKFSLMTEALAMHVDIIRAYEAANGRKEDQPSGAVPDHAREL